MNSARVLVLCTSTEASDEHVAAMNVAFAAKKQVWTVRAAWLAV